MRRFTLTAVWCEYRDRTAGWVSVPHPRPFPPPGYSELVTNLTRGLPVITSPIAGKLLHSLFGWNPDRPLIVTTRKPVDPGYYAGAGYGPNVVSIQGLANAALLAAKHAPRAYLVTGPGLLAAALAEPNLVDALVVARVDRPGLGDRTVLGRIGAFEQVTRRSGPEFDRTEYTLRSPWRLVL